MNDDTPSLADVPPTDADAETPAPAKPYQYPEATRVVPMKRDAFGRMY